MIIFYVVIAVIANLIIPNRIVSTLLSSVLSFGLTKLLLGGHIPSAEGLFGENSVTAMLASAGTCAIVSFVFYRRDKTGKSGKRN